VTPSIGLVALDLDGTVLRPDRTISRAVRDAVAAASLRVPCVIASARPPRSVRAIYDALGLTTRAVLYNGAVTWDFAGDRFVTHVSIPADVTSSLIHFARAMWPDVIVNVEHVDRWFTDRVSDRFVTETGRLFGPTLVAPLAAYADLGATKLMFHAEPTEIDALRAVLEPRFAGVTFIRTDPDLLQMMSAGTSKWRGLVALAASHGVDPSNILAIGDNENDLEMLAGAGVGVAMANGTEAAKAASDWIAPSNVDDGVAVAIERFVLAPTRVPQPRS
jgi:Cof subfamily protein (haloacid dehalogenase superfamily)